MKLSDDVKPFDHLVLASVLRRHLDEGISMTVRLKPDEDIPDISIPGWAITVRRGDGVATGEIASWQSYAVSEAHRAGASPCLAMRRGYGFWRFCVPLGLLTEDLAGPWSDIENLAELSLAGFVTLVRVHLNG